MKSKYSTSFATLESSYQERFEALAVKTESLLQANESKVSRMAENWKAFPNASVIKKRIGKCLPILSHAGGLGFISLEKTLGFGG